MVRDISSLEESLSLLLQPELLCGENKYHCSGCDSKVDAYKGISFETLPPILTFQFNRFDYNYMTMARIKINSKFEFPMQLNMKKYKTSTTEEENNKNLLYELVAVMVHSGTANGGHYYAFIKDIYKNLWFKFNDDVVTQVCEDEIQNTFGDSSAGRPSSSGNAYMVIYRNSEEINELFPNLLDFSMKEYIPKSLYNEIEKENQIFKEEKEKFELQKSLVHIQLLSSKSKDKKTQLISIPKFQTINEAKVSKKSKKT